MQYNNIIRPGTRSTTSINPRALMEDIDNRIRTLSPESTPVLTLGNYMGRGAKPTSHKIQVIQYDSFDHYDYANSIVLGTASGGANRASYGRFARLRLTQPSRPNTQETMPYFPQDKFVILATGQVVEVVMTPTASMTRSLDNVSRYAFDTEFTGGTTGTTAAGHIIVRTIEDVPFAACTTSDVIFMDRTIYESQKIEASGLERDYFFDCNFVEHKEKVLSMTEDQYKWIKTRGTVPDWTFQQTEMIKEFKRSIDYQMLWGERAVDMTIPGRPKRHMRGLFNSIQTNVAYYNPDTTDDLEILIQNFAYDMAFRYNPNGKKKIGLCGGRFLLNFNNVFREYRRTSGTNPGDKKVGLDLDTYVLPGGFELSLVRTELLRQGTSVEDWCFVIDPVEMEQRIVKDFATRMYANNDERDQKLMIEWQGTVAWHVEQSHALLRTV